MLVKDIFRVVASLILICVANIASGQNQMADTLKGEFIGEFQTVSSCKACHIRAELIVNENSRFLAVHMKGRSGSLNRYVVPQSGESLEVESSKVYMKDTLRFVSDRFKVLVLPEGDLIGIMLDEGEILAEISMVNDD